MDLFAAEPLSLISKAIHDDLVSVQTVLAETTAGVVEPFAGMGALSESLAATAGAWSLTSNAKLSNNLLSHIEVKFGDVNKWLVDYNEKKYKFGEKGDWSSFELPEWSLEETQRHVENHLRAATRELYDDPAARHALVGGTLQSLGVMTRRLANQGDGHLAALSIDEIMRDAVTFAVKQNEHMLTSPHSWSVLQDAWKSILETCCKAVYGQTYARALTRARLSTLRGITHMAVQVLVGRTA